MYRLNQYQEIDNGSVHILMDKVIYIDNSVSSSKELILLAVDDDKKAYYQMCNGIQKN